VISWLTSGSGWGTREQAIPGEWAALVLIMVLGALLGLLVLWFTVLRHERTVRHRAALRPGPGPDVMVAFAGLGAAADEKGSPTDPETTTEAGAEPESESESESELELEDADDDAGVEVDAASEVREASGVNGPDEAGDASEVGESGELDGEPTAGDGDENDEEAAENAPERSAQRSAASQATANSGKRKLTDEILSRIESELAGRRTPRWKELAELVHREFGVSVHPSSIQRAVKKRRVAAARGEMGRVGDAGRAADEMGGAGMAESGAEPVAQHAAEPVAESGAELVTQSAPEAAPASVEPRVEAGDGVRPNGGRRATAWSSPACPAGDAG
jgi:hypothetical protein